MPCCLSSTERGDVNGLDTVIAYYQNFILVIFSCGHEIEMKIDTKNMFGFFDYLCVIFHSVNVSQLTELTRNLHHERFEQRQQQQSVPINLLRTANLFLTADAC